MSLLLISSLALLGCSKGDAVDTSPVEDTGPGVHPNVPEGYELFWDTDGCGASGNETQAYVLGEGSISEDGETLTMTETWYWFFGGDRSDDCIDTFEFTSGTKLTSAQLANFNASEAEAGYYGVYTKTENNCPGMNYYATWSHPGEDGFEYGDDISAEMILIFDYANPNGNLNYENKMLVFAYIGEDGSFTWGDTNYDSAGVFTPTGDDAAGPPATVTWEPSFCFDGGEG